LDNNMTRKFKDRFLQLILTIATLFLTFLPIEVFLLVWHSLGPMTVLEKLGTLGIGLYFGGGIQIFLFVFGIAFLRVIWK